MITFVMQARMALIFLDSPRFPCKARFRHKARFCKARSCNSRFLKGGQMIAFVMQARMVLIFLDSPRFRCKAIFRRKAGFHHKARFHKVRSCNARFLKRRSDDYFCKLLLARFHGKSRFAANLALRWNLALRRNLALQRNLDESKNINAMTKVIIWPPF